MEESILSSIAEGIIGQLGNAAVKEIGSLWGVEDELDQLEDTITTIKGVLAHAEKQQTHNDQIRIWLQRLEDVVYEADDLVDGFSTEGLRQQVMSGSKMLKQVRTFCSPSNQFIFRHKMVLRIRDIRKKLDVIADDKKYFHLESGLGLGDTKLVSPGGWETYSFVRKEQVVGRDDDKMAIMKLIFDIKTDENIGVIAIVGVGGLGKTTLAQLVFNDEKVKEHFELTMWVNVPKDFDVKSVIREITKSGEKDERPLDELQKDVQEKLNRKRYFLVLDDMWDENCEKWLKLENLLRDGAYGSRIIVTTRSKRVADIVRGTMEPYLLGLLDSEKSWDLFKKVAFKRGVEPKDSEIVKIGKEITKKCGGIPLVIRTTGSMLYSIDQEEWSSFSEKELSRVSGYEDDIIPRLKLSYDRLPSHLKHCFSYCSLFPKNHKIDVQKLTHLWMAQGFIKLPSDSRQLLEDVGYEHFRDLLWRSFFHDVEMDKLSKNVIKCKMHDCMHDLATFVAGKECIILRSDDVGNKIDEKRTRHSSLFIIPSSSDKQFPTSFVQARRIRTILRVSVYGLPGKHIVSELLGLELLRTLDLCEACMDVVPNSIGMLNHLRYLDLSRNYDMKALPNSITRLQNLQTLDLSYCRSLGALPEGITKLVNLRHLKTYGCQSLIHMPRGLGRLTNLQTLSRFPLDADAARYSRHPSGELNELENLNNLRGILEIIVKKDGTESKAANLKEKLHLQTLWLKIQGTIVDEGEGFLPHTNLRELILHGDHIHLCVGMLNCVQSLTNLVKFSLWNHKECQYLPPLNHLPCLEVLDLYDLPALEYISSNNDNSFFLPSSSSSMFFPSLQILTLSEIPNLKGWWKDTENAVSSSTNTITTAIPSFPCLSHLVIRKCPKLISMPLYPYLEKELFLENTSLNPFQQTLMMTNVEGRQTANEASASASTSFTFPTSALILPLSKLTSLQIIYADLLCFPESFGSLTSIKELSIRECHRLQSLSPGIQHLTSLQTLEVVNCQELYIISSGSDATVWRSLGSICTLLLYGLPKLVALPEGLQQVTSLRRIQIRQCDNLVDIMECISSLKSLKELEIRDCPSLRSLPQGIDCLPSLQRLEIVDCPILLERFRMDMGDYWPKICHIQMLVLDPSPEASSSQAIIFANGRRQICFWVGVLRDVHSHCIIGNGDIGSGVLTKKVMENSFSLLWNHLIRFLEQSNKLRDQVAKQQQGSLPISETWKLPPKGWIKVHIDVFNKDNGSAMVMVVRDKWNVRSTVTTLGHHVSVFDRNWPFIKFIVGYWNV
ncbi:hypothetical protein FNV43_RR19709 [Rhamnella rubrinervis]|uniref:Disease resistance protein RGA3 n=1 Tax=Rhamnella rubrinervis TaxID=2594499 RepID=A0A8K0DUK8_9ROSA|nr:hypothetical protein FNV43_RR19709 [Rhamnella rubrinervis]